VGRKDKYNDRIEERDKKKKEKLVKAKGGEGREKSISRAKKCLCIYIDDLRIYI
jgi:hypothetical protein